MSEVENFDAIIIGSGQAGKPLATELAGGGWKVANCVSLTRCCSSSCASIVTGDESAPLQGVVRDRAARALPSSAVASHRGRKGSPTCRGRRTLR